MKHILISIAFFLILGQASHAQYRFTIEKNVPVTPVMNQHRTGTCWSFATTSFLESELIRLGKGEHDLAEMYFVRKAYEMKADKYVRMHGRTNFSQGGLAMDVLHFISESGMMPGEAYTGHTYGGSLPVHNEMDAQLRTYVGSVIKNPNGELSTVWKEGFSGMLDAYLGEEPAEFEYQGKSYSARTFADEMGVNPDDYVAVGSYTHQPFYESFILEIPDNWLWSSIYNVPLDEMMLVLDHALENGYSVCWDTDMSEIGYSWKAGLAMIPKYDTKELSKEKKAKWDALDSRQKRKHFYDYFTPGMEESISQELRQKWFDNYKTTDDHLEHITGIARDQDGKRFYRVKNSWGSKDHIFDGYHYVSVNYMRAKTIFFLLHKEALPPHLAEKLGL